MNLSNNYLGFYSPMIKSIKRLLDTTHDFDDVQSINPDTSLNDFTNTVNLL